MRKKAKQKYKDLTELNGDPLGKIGAMVKDVGPDPTVIARELGIDQKTMLQIQNGIKSAKN